MVSELFYSVVWLVVCTWTGADSLDNETRPNPTHGLSLEHRSVDDSGDIWTPAHTHVDIHTSVTHTHWRTELQDAGESMMSWVRSQCGPPATHTPPNSVLVATSRKGKTFWKKDWENFENLCANLCIF